MDKYQLEEYTGYNQDDFEASINFKFAEISFIIVNR